MEKTTTRTITAQELEGFKFLNNLRNSGVTNMFGATPYLVEGLDIDKSTARELLTLWMSNFNEAGYTRGQQVTITSK